MGEFSSEKAAYLMYLFAVMIVLGYGYIGAVSAQKEAIVFYVALLGLPGIAYVFFDWATSGRELEEIDTITLEEPPDQLSWLTPRAQIIIGLVLGALVFYKIAVTGSAFVDAPKWGIFDNPVGNAVFSALIAPIENLMFFGAIFPTIRTNAEKRLGSAPAVIIAALLTMSIFTAYHTWRYGFSETALVSVAVFALIGAASVAVSNSLIIIDVVHGANNLAVGLNLSRRIALAIIL